MSYMLQPGDRVGEYEFRNILGMGGFGVTYHAVELTSHRQVAIKEYFPSIAHRDAGRQTVRPKGQSHQQEYAIGLDRFRKEARILARFKHINVVRVLNVFEANGTAYMVMEYEQGQDLSKWMAKAGRPLNFSEIIAFFIPILDGLRILHREKVLHLDLKPANIFIRTNSVPCLIDFGGARHYAAQESRLVVGNVSFMVATDGFSPPEQYSGDLNSKGPWSDVYALAATMYACMDKGKAPPSSMERSGNLMNGGADPLHPAARRFKGQYPADLLELIDRCLSPQRSRRPQNAQEMQDILIQIANQQPVAWKAPSTPQPLPSVVISSDFSYAGFWLRLAALLVDGILVGLPLNLLGSGLLAAGLGNSGAGLVFYLAITLILNWAYFAGMESSAKGGTIGKRVVGIRVVDVQGQRISLARATGRWFGKLLSGLFLGIGYLMAGFTRQKQAMHDLMSETLVIRNA